MPSSLRTCISNENHALELDVENIDEAYPPAVYSRFPCCDISALIHESTNTAIPTVLNMRAHDGLCWLKDHYALRRQGVVFSMRWSADFDCGEIINGRHRRCPPTLKLLIQRNSSGMRCGRVIAKIRLECYEVALE